MEFKCTECHYPDEDNTLHLIVKETGRREFTIKSDGVLEFYDADGDGQEIYLECPVCGQKYEFDNFELQIEDIPRLVLYADHRSLKVVTPVLKDLTFKKK